MAKRMLIDATHPDETRVVVLSGKTVEEFDYETASKAQIKGNIYLAKVTRVEPSLQAAFIDYGGNRHGFLPFSEIHPDYYRIPIADREALIAEEARLRGEAVEAAADEAEGSGNGAEADEEREAEAESARARPRRRRASRAEADDEAQVGDGQGSVEEIAQETNVDTVGGEEVEDQARRRAQLLRRYKIQEVIKRRQVMLVQVTKEERGNKGAALTTYLSLAGRYCVLMPNTAKGGGISRKISNAADRRRLKSVVGEMSIPEGMAVIVRTAGSERTKAEIKRDYEYLLRLWDDVRGKTLQSTAPCQIHEEASLIKRAIRDLYDRDMDDVLVEGAEGYKAAKDFMKMLMPSHARKVKVYDDPGMPLFHRYQVESQLDAMYSPQVQLRSGGSIVLNPTEALVAIDVNSGRSTRERHIEETALKTNLEAADEVARQLRLRDLAGLIVIDFIDMEEPRHNREVERRLKEAMKVDRARIQLGRISPFGLLELSRQRLRPSLFETAMTHCQRCNGTGYVRAPDAAALVVLRALTEEGVRKGGGELEVKVPLEVALHMLNEKRAHVVELEQRFGLTVLVRADDRMGPADFEILRHSTEASPVHEARALPAPEEPEEEIAEEEEEEEEREERTAREPREGEEGGRRRPRRRRGGRRDRGEERPAAERAAGERTTGERSELPEPADEEEEEGEERGSEVRAAEDDDEERRGKRRRRGRRGGRRRSRRRQDEPGAEGQETAAAGATDEGQPEDGDGFGDMSEERPEVPPEMPYEAPEALPAAAAEAAPAESRSEPVAAEPETAEPAADAEAAPKKRTRRPRTRKAAEPAPAETGVAEATPAEGAAAQAEGAEPAASEAAAEETAEPKKPARRRRKTAAGDEAEAKAEAKPAAKKPATRSRRKPKAEVAAEAPAEAAAPNGAAEPAPAAESAAAGSPAPEAPAEPEATAEEAPAPAPAAASAESDQPRRKGWWNRLMS
ncbi:RNAse E [Tistlia consotensis]|uniref:Ribonuclease E n=1 Tax=Tistlia consotensis USBA 355 TaxID=560819 RepID=A0A1Y6CIX9_9PROT|nr:ribonuclease E/G [Tistlia consotensis]SMF67261.1 RNAse E [Tistlia consotensis USBA 355]SNS00149.1 RNAse E [Tistlia consotensis]